MYERTRFETTPHSQKVVQDSDAYIPMVNGKGKASPPDRRMWLMALRVCEMTGLVMPSLLPEISNKLRPQAPSVIERGREVP